MSLHLLDIPLMILTLWSLNDLGPGFREFSASVHTRDTPLLFDELYNKFVDHEIFIQRDECH